MEPFVRTKFIKNETLSEEENLIYEKAHERLTLLGKNQLNIKGIHFSETEEILTVKTIIRTTIQKPILFKKKLSIALFNDHNEFITEEEFDLSDLDPLEPNSAYPYTFHFSKNELFKSNFTLNNSWKIVFKQGKDRLDLSDSPMSKESRQELEKLLDKIGPPKEDEINILGLSLRKLSTGDIQTTVLVRNGSKEPIDIKKLPMQIVTPKQEIVAQGTFSLEGLIVKPYTSKPASFVFPRKSILLQDVDLASCKIQAGT